ncbi:MAG: relaxase/mobilization nuclease domain-containing protein [Clostridia bacterium]|nr:relaxase/mobilization nuclease domain-containing protein [Clostridia bacterium]
MATIKAVNKGGGASTKARIEYVEDELKTSPELMSGINCSSDPKLAIADMQFTKEVWDKTRGRQTLHFVQSFAPGEGTPEDVHAIGVKLAEECPAWEGFEVFVATHTNRDCLHNHFVINTVSVIDGHKIQISKSDLQQIKDLNDKLCQERGYSVPQKIQSFQKSQTYHDTRIGYSNETYAVLQKSKKEYADSYIVNIRATIADVMGAVEPETKEQFMEAMQERGIAVRWKKHVTFTDLQRQEAGEKKCKIRDKKLQQMFPEWDLSKERLLGWFSKYREEHGMADLEQLSEAWEEQDFGLDFEDKKNLINLFEDVAKELGLLDEDWEDEWDNEEDVDELVEQIEESFGLNAETIKQLGEDDLWQIIADRFGEADISAIKDMYYARWLETQERDWGER